MMSHPSQAYGDISEEAMENCSEILAGSAIPSKCQLRE
jgi:hypothetical protein